jgi:hypothetical protein
MKHLQPLFLLAGAWACISACDLTLDLPVPDHSPRLVINAVLNPDERVRATVSRSASLGEAADTDLFLRDAQVYLWEGGQQITRLRYRDTLWRRYFSTFPNDYEEIRSRDFVANFYPEPGKTYVLRVSHPLYDSAWGSCTVPHAPRVSKLELALNVGALGGVPLSRMDVSLSDHPGIAEAYFLPSLVLEPARCQFVDELGNVRTDFFDIWGLLKTGVAADLEASALDNYVVPLFDDPGADGDSSSVSIFASFPLSNQPGYSLRRAEFTLWACDEAFYRYFSARDLHLLSQVSNRYPFRAEPAGMYSNISGGYGVVAAFHARRLDWAF